MQAQSKPQALLTVNQRLNAHAQARRVNNECGIGVYFRSAENLLRQARVYQRLQDDLQAYVFLLRFTSLVLETLPQHRDFRPNDNKQKRLRKIIENGLMDELECLKQRVNLPTADLPVQNRYAESEWPAEAVQTSLTPLPALNWDRYALQPSAPSTTGAATSSAISALLPASGDTQPNLLPFDPGQLSSYSISDLPAASAEALQRHTVLPVANTERRRPPERQKLQTRHALYPSFDSGPPQPIKYGVNSNMPSGPPLSGDSHTQGAVLSLMDAEPMALPPYVPPPPPLLPMPSQLQQDLRQQQDMHVQPRLELQLGPQELPVDIVSPETGGVCSHSQGSTSITDVSPLDKPPGFKGVRDVHVSVSLMEDFMRLCQHNTKRNIETIGLLGGALSSDGTCFNINTLIIPKQKGETDRVEMLKEEELWDVFFQEGQDAPSQALYPVGWIHTHPAFDCFLSSVDIHNQYGYQVMLDEAVAIVMSPRDSQDRKCGMFRLTTPGGMDLIKGCSGTGFHSHPSTSTGQTIYELCGHVFVNPRIDHNVIDLRNR